MQLKIFFVPNINCFNLFIFHFSAAMIYHFSDKRKKSIEKRSNAETQHNLQHINKYNFF